MAVYLDCAATTPLDSRVRDEVFKYLDLEFGNAGSRTHDYGRRARRAVEQARDRVASVVSARRSEVVFTSGATESNNVAILGLAEEGRRTGRTHVVSTRIEHKAVLEPLAHLEKNGFRITLVSPDSLGGVSADRIREALREDTLLVSVMQVNNETGVVQPIVEISRALDGHPAFFHVDAAQGFGKVLEPLRDPRIDLVSISGHKLFAPKGVGALVARRREGERLPLSPLMHGGGQEQGLRPGTLPVALVVGLGKAAELALEETETRARSCRAFRERLLEALRPLEPRVNGDLESTVPHIVNLSFPGIDGEEAMEELSGLIAISDGSACTSESKTCSHVLDAMGADGWRLEGALRFSWCHTTEEPDWAEVVSVLKRLQQTVAPRA